MRDIITTLVVKLIKNLA